MKKIILLGLAALLLFGLSASVSWVLRNSKTPPANSGAREELPPLKFPDRTDRDPAAQKKPSGPSSPLPSAARPPFTAGTDEAVQLAASLRERLTAVREKEAQQSARLKQLELIYLDISGERGAVDELRQQVKDELRAVDEKMAAVEKKVSAAEQNRQSNTRREADLQKNLLELEGVEQKNIKRMAEIYNSMEPESAARILEKLATKELDTAVKIVGEMKERQAAKLLAALPPDSGLAAQLLEKLKGFKRPSAPVNK